MTRPDDTEAVLLRILRHTSEPDERGCLLWTSWVSGDGYPSIDLNATTRIHPHVWLLEWWEGRPLLPGQVSDHCCERRRCINPFHLQRVTMRENLLRAHQPLRRAYRALPTPERAVLAMLMGEAA